MLLTYALLMERQINETVEHNKIKICSPQASFSDGKYQPSTEHRLIVSH